MLPTKKITMQAQPDQDECRPKYKYVSKTRQYEDQSNTPINNCFGFVAKWFASLLHNEVYDLESEIRSAR